LFLLIVFFNGQQSAICALTAFDQGRNSKGVFSRVCCLQASFCKQANALELNRPVKAGMSKWISVCMPRFSIVSFFVVQEDLPCQKSKTKQGSCGIGIYVGKVTTKFITKSLQRTGRWWTN